MARVKNPILGSYSGRMGNIVYRVINGNTYVSVRPLKYKPSKSPAAKRVKNNFSAVVNLARSVNAVPALKNVWKTSEVEGYSPYHKLIRNNIALISEGNLTTENIITPEGLDLELSSLSVLKNNLNAGFTFQENANVKFPLELHGFFYFKDYNKRILSFIEKINEPEPNGVYNLSIPLNPYITKGLKEDPHPLVYLAVAGSVPPKKKIYWSGTAARQL